MSRGTSTFRETDVIDLSGALLKPTLAIKMLLRGLFSEWTLCDKRSSKFQRHETRNA